MEFLTKIKAGIFNVLGATGSKTAWVTVAVAMIAVMSSVSNFKLACISVVAGCYILKEGIVKIADAVAKRIEK